MVATFRVQTTAPSCKPFPLAQPLWKEKLRASLAERAANWEQHRANQWTAALLPHVEAAAPLAGHHTAKRVVRNFRRVLGHEALRRVLTEQGNRHAGYEPGRAASCLYLTVRMKPGPENLEADLAKLMRHGFVLADTKATGIHSIANVPADRRAEVLLATIERDQIGVHIHAVIANRSGADLEKFQALVRASVARLPFAAEVHTKAITNDTEIARTVAYSMKRAVPILSGAYPAIFMGNLYSAEEWRCFAKELVLS